MSGPVHPTRVISNAASMLRGNATQVARIERVVQLKEELYGDGAAAEPWPELLELARTTRATLLLLEGLAAWVNQARLS